MRLLLDTHTFLWFIMGSPKLSGTVRALIEADEHERLLSTASLWEMAIKLSLGRLTLAEPVDVLIPRQLRLNGIQLLNIEIEHIAVVATLPFHHRDPFDGLLIAQSTVERLPILSAEPAFDTYSIERMW
jgi:PIN domain nuclease of toxin-antitoxin system